MINVKDLFKQYAMWDDAYQQTAQDLYKYSDDEEFMGEFNKISMELSSARQALLTHFPLNQVERLARLPHPLRFTNPTYRDLCERFEAEEDKADHFCYLHRVYTGLISKLWNNCEDASYVKRCAAAEIAVKEAWAALTPDDLDDVGAVTGCENIARCAADWGYPTACADSSVKAGE